jgi:hypothetical protein
MRGRKPKLFAIASREGNTGKRRPRPAPPAVSGDFEPPFELGGIARAEWDRIRVEAPWISAASAGVLAMRCATYGDWVNIRREIAESKDPDWRIHQRERDAKNYIMRADTELGLTSVAQQKVSAPSTAATDALDEAIG